MKRSLIIALPLVLVIIVIVAVSAYLSGSTAGSVPANVKLISSSGSGNEDIKKTSCCAESVEKGIFTESSLYQLESNWNNEYNKKVALGDLKGKKVVLSMIFANCTYACPIIVNDMKKVEAALSEREKRDVRFVLVSIDPERDTPQALKEYSQRMNLDLNRWELMTGSQSDVRKLAALLGFRYKKDEKGDYIHSNLINVLNKQGELVLQHEGLNRDVNDVVRSLDKIN
ncbi:MAG: SCO family protein [Ignavibacteriales bacterium]